MKILLDTCAIIWAISEPGLLSKKVRDLITEDNTEIFVSPISCAEIACAQLRKKLILDRHWKIWFRHFIEINNWEIIPIDLAVIEEAYSLPSTFHSDPADRLIVATCRLNRMSLISKDEKILKYPYVDSIW
jgi:PIN domain nuclease of toxin-antitoxin system